MKKYTIEILPDENGLNEENGNVDVIVTLESGEKFAPTFFTLNNMKLIMDRYQKTGECANGLYFWAADMIVVERLTEEVIMASVADLVNSGEIFSVCVQLS